VLLPDMYGAFFSEIVRGIDREARAAGYHLLVSGSHSDPAETEQVLHALHGRVDGLILMAPGLGNAWLDECLPRRLPLVLLNPRRENEANANGSQRARVAGAGATGGNAALHPSVRIANRHGARLAVEYLIGLGHREIAVITGPADNSDASERLRGYEEELRRHGIAPQARLEIPGDFSEESGARAGLAVAQLSPRPTAVFAANDEMAIGCLAALREAELGVPADLSLVGFDDIPIARHVTPPLTTVHVPIAELGTRAMERLLELVDAQSPHEGRQDTVATTLVVRGSTGRPRETNRKRMAKRSKGETS
jgi:LacI family transcriptional regulator